jgi:hypothetical protein
VVAGLTVTAGCVGLWSLPESAVVLESTPAGAEVVLDGRPVGRTPLRLASRPWPLQGQVEVRLAGFRAWSSPLAAGLAETRQVDLRLEPLPASLSLSSSPPGAEVSLDGRTVGQTPLALADLPPGRHDLGLTLAGYQSWQASLELEPGGSVARDVRLVAAPVAATALDSEQPAPSAAGAGAAGGEPTSAEAAKTAPPAGPEPMPTIPPPGGGQPPYPVAVMIENAPDARPQSGLASADVVYEALAEGGISRFMAVYLAGSAPVVGPVRSARHYFVNLAAEFGASLVHIGASPLGYDALHGFGMRDLDETFGQPGFWRSRARWAPHNAYTSIPGAREALDGRAPGVAGSWAGFTFKDPARQYDGPPAPQISLEYRPWGYRVEYRYDAASGRYARFMEGAPHRDAESSAQLQAANVAVMWVSAWVIDGAGRLDMDQVGSARAVYFVDGVAVEGTWRKETPGEITRFLDRDGNPVRFNPGPIWVQLIAYEGQVTY